MGVITVFVWRWSDVWCMEFLLINFEWVSVCYEQCWMYDWMYLYFSPLLVERGGELFWHKSHLLWSVVVIIESFLCNTVLSLFTLDPWWCFSSGFDCYLLWLFVVVALVWLMWKCNWKSNFKWRIIEIREEEPLLIDWVTLMVEEEECTSGEDDNDNFF